MKKARILIVEDEPVIAADLEACLCRFGYEIVGTLDNGEDAIVQVSALKPDLVLMDIMLAGPADGIKTAALLNVNDDTPVVFVTSHADPATLVRARESAPFGYVLKPFAPRALQATIEIALHRSRSESSHRKAEQWLITTLRSLGDAVIAMDRQSRITFMNPVAERLTGWVQSDALGLEFGKVFGAVSEATNQPLINLAEDAMQEGETRLYHAGIRLRSKTGSEASIEETFAPVRNEEGQITGAVVVFRDCTARSEAEKEMRRVQAELTRSNETLTAKQSELEGFYHTVSHELKTPLTAAREFVSLVLEGLAGPVTSTQVEYLGTAQESCDQMKACINDLLDSTRLETGKMSLETKPCSLGALAQRVAAMLAPAATNKRLKLETIIDPDLPEIGVDPHRITQVIANLLNNAIKFTPAEGSITLAVGLAGKDKSGLKVTVTDTGCGISAEHLGRVFDRLYQVRGDDVSNGKGLGLGLHICQELVRLHAGTIWAESQPGQGSVFSFVLPFQTSTRRRVLIVDDDLVIRKLLGEILEKAGFEVAHAAEGTEALARMAEHPADLVILDLNMPKVNGLDTLQQLRQFHPTLPVVIHTGYPNGALMARALQHSPVTLLAKPCEPSRVISAVTQTMQAAAHLN